MSKGMFSHFKENSKVDLKEAFVSVKQKKTMKFWPLTWKRQ